jgi:hypothetical protein
MKVYLIIIIILLYQTSFSQQKAVTDTGNIYVKFISNIAKTQPYFTSNPYITPYITIYEKGGSNIITGSLPLYKWSEFPCYTENAVELITDLSFNKGEELKIPGTFHRGDSILIDLDKQTTNIINKKN